MPNAIVNFGLRGFQVICAAIVLGLSVGLIKGQADGTSSPITLKYAAFVGGVSFVGAFIGIASEWISALQGMIGVIIDGVITLVNLAGGVLLAIKIKGVNCSNNSDEYRAEHLFYNDLFNGGCAGKGDDMRCLNWFDGRRQYLNSRCKMSQADAVFMFFIVAICLASMTMTFLRMKKGY